MSAMKEALEEFLTNDGKQLGYDKDNHPKIKDIHQVIANNIPAWEYFGFKTKKEYYGGNKDG